jgi:hypothetical protein
LTPSIVVFVVALLLIVIIIASNKAIKKKIPWEGRGRGKKKGLGRLGFQTPFLLYSSISQSWEALLEDIPLDWDYSIIKSARLFIDQSESL